MSVQPSKPQLIQHSEHKTDLLKGLRAATKEPAAAATTAPVKRVFIPAFSLTPKEGFEKMDPHSMLFDHTLLSSGSSPITSGSSPITSGSSPITFRCGNTMALSAPGKGLPGSKQAKYKTFFNEHGEDITKAWVETVNEAVRNNNNGQLFKDKNNLEARWTYETITSAKQKKKKNLQEGEVDPMISIVTSIFTTVISKIEDFCNKEIFNHPEREFPVKDVKEQKKMIERLKKFGGKLKKKDVFRIDKTYQIIFFNDLWGTQGFGGFDVENTEYDGFKTASLDENRGIVNDGGLFKTYIEQSINNVDVLFLCESVRLNDSLEGYDHITIESDSVNGKSYSAICKSNNNIEISLPVLFSSEIRQPNFDLIQIKISRRNTPLTCSSLPDISLPGNLSHKDFGIFDIKKDSQQIRVMVVHMDETLEGWPNMISWCKKNEINYIVGDTNITKKKSDTTAELFFTKLNLSGIYSKKEIEKLRQGNSIENDVNGFLNNQINKGGDGRAEIDGMVILNISDGVAAPAPAAPAAPAPAAANAAAGAGAGAGAATDRLKDNPVGRVGKNIDGAVSNVVSAAKGFGNFLGRIRNQTGGKRKKKTKRKKRKKSRKKRTKRKR